MKTTPYMLCSHCRGHGLVYGYMGEPTDCHYCGLSGIERARDARGRFARIDVDNPFAVDLTATVEW